MTITEWQREFFAGPRVWVVAYREDGNGNLYESEEAAKEEMAWRKRTGLATNYRLVSRCVHTLRLAQERWKEGGLRRGDG